MCDCVSPKTLAVVAGQPQRAEDGCPAFYGQVRETIMILPRLPWQRQHKLIPFLAESEVVPGRLAD